MRNIISKLLIAAGFFFICFFFFLLWQRYYTRPVPVIQLSSIKTTVVYNWNEQPIQIIIPNLQINLPVFNSHIVNGTWETTAKGVSYLSSTPIPGNTGNSVLYAHNWSALFGNLYKVKPGEKIQILYTNKKMRTYTIYYTATVSPNQLHILDASRDRRITLYTCTGFLDSQRFVTVALLDR